jgi:soluble P-type ATPase
VDDRWALAGRTALFEDKGFEVPQGVERARRAAQEDGKTTVVAGWDMYARAGLVTADEPKPTSAEAIRELRALGLTPVLLTGDNEMTAKRVASQVGIDEVIAEVLPGDKSDVVRELQEQGRVVAMVGDGVNDSPALAQADLGIAIGSGSDAAIEAAELTLVSGDLRAAADAIRLSRRTLRTIKGNLLWAFFYNVLALPLAALGYLNPLIAGAAMSCSSVFVVSNSLRLRAFKGHSAAAPEMEPAADPTAAEPLVPAAPDALAPAAGWDHEADLKLLLDLAIGRDLIERQERDELLREHAGETGARLVFQGARRERAIAWEARASARRLPLYRDLMDALDVAGLLDAERDRLPAPAELEAREAAGLGLEEHECAVLFELAELHVTRMLEASVVPDEPYLLGDLRRYFPAPVVRRFGELLAEHPSRRRLVAAISADMVVGTMGPTFVPRLVRLLAVEQHEVVRTFRIACGVTDSNIRWDEIERVADSLPAETYDELRGAVDDLVDVVTRWYLTHPRTDMQRAVNAGQEAFEWLVQEGPDAAPLSWHRRWLDTIARLTAQGAPEELAHAHALQPQFRQVPDMVLVAERTARGVEEVAEMFFLCGEQLGIDWLEQRLERIEPATATEAWVLEAARDDARRTRSELAMRALAAAHGQPVDEAFRRFLARDPSGLARLETLTTSLLVDEPGQLAGVALAIRQLRSLA